MHLASRVVILILSLLQPLSVDGCRSQRASAVYVYPTPLPATTTTTLPPTTKAQPTSATTPYPTTTRTVIAAGGGKPGTCPPSLNVFSLGEQCQLDSQCTGDHKCCPLSATMNDKYCSNVT